MTLGWRRLSPSAELFVDPQSGARCAVSRIEDAYYARNADIKASAQGRAPAAIVCQTLDEFIVKLTEDGYPIDGIYRATMRCAVSRR